MSKPRWNRATFEVGETRYGAGRAELSRCRNRPAATTLGTSAWRAIATNWRDPVAETEHLTLRPRPPLKVIARRFFESPRHHGANPLVVAC